MLVATRPCTAGQDVTPGECASGYGKLTAFANNLLGIGNKVVTKQNVVACQLRQAEVDQRLLFEGDKSAIVHLYDVRPLQ